MGVARRVDPLEGVVALEGAVWRLDEVPRRGNVGNGVSGGCSTGAGLARLSTEWSWPSSAGAASLAASAGAACCWESRCELAGARGEAAGARGACAKGLVGG